MSKLFELQKSDRQEVIISSGPMKKYYDVLLKKHSEIKVVEDPVDDGDKIRFYTLPKNAIYYGFYAYAPLHGYTVDKSTLIVKEWIPELPREYLEDDEWDEEIKALSREFS